jgi:hypothetical protein
VFDGPVDYGFRTTEAYYDDVLGAEQIFTDNLTTATSVQNINSGNKVIAKIVRNVSGGTLVPGSVVTWAADGVGRTIGGTAGLNGIGAGVVDPTLSSNVANGEAFLLFVYGPVEVLSSVAISAGASVKTAASGKSVTNTFTAVADHAAGFGKQMVAATGADQLRRTFVDFRVV